MDPSEKKERRETNLYFRNGRWYVDFSFDYKRVRRFAGYTKEAARSFLAKLRFEQAMGIKRERRPEILFEKWFEKFKSIYTRNRQSHEWSFKACEPFFKGRALHGITRELIEQYRDERRKKISGSSVNREISFLKLLFRVAVDEGYLGENPASKVKKFEEAPPRERILSEVEARSILEKCGSRLRAILTIGLNTGLRPGPSELLGLRWSDINFPRKYLTIERPKERKRKEVPLNEDALEALRSIKKTSSPFVFGGIRSIRKQFKNAAHRADVKGWKKLRPYDMRHTFGTSLAMAGVPLPTLGKILGHSSIRTTERYVHATDESRRAAVSLLENRFGGRHFHDTPSFPVVLKRLPSATKRDN